MGGDGAGWYWQLGTNRRSGIKNVRDTLDSAMAQLKKPKQVAQDVAQSSSMRQNPTPRTDEATYPADCLGKTLVVNRDCAAALETELAQLRAELADQASRFHDEIAHRQEVVRANKALDLKELAQLRAAMKEASK